MDEQQWSGLFREAVGEPPPASFGRDEVVAAARRGTVRRRGMAAAGTLLGLGVLAVGLLSSGVLDRTRAEVTTAGQAPPGADTRIAPHPLGTAPGVATATPRAGVPGAAGQASCVPTDDELATQVRAVLAERGSEVAGSSGAVPGPCPAGSRAAAVPVPGGTLYVLVLPQVQPPERVDVVWPDGRREHALMLEGGRGLLVISVPAVPGQPTALNDDVPDLAEQLAERL